LQEIEFDGWISWPDRLISINIIWRRRRRTDQSIEQMGKLVGKSVQESKLLWHIAFPAILTAVFQFSIGFVTVGFAGHIGEVELAAVAVVENVIEGFAYGILVSHARAKRLLAGQLAHR
jgi:Na+-driven multidrug efflux pump